MLTPGRKVHVRLADGRVAEAEYRGHYAGKTHLVLSERRNLLAGIKKSAPTFYCRFICTSNLSPEKLREMMR